MKGIIVGCDQNQEWMLEWWWSRYSQHSSYPVAFIDFGMSNKMQQWCRNNGHWVLLESPRNFVVPPALLAPDVVARWERIYGTDLWNKRQKRFYKPYALQQIPFDQGIWVDVDCEVTGPLDPLFQKIHPGSKIALVKEPHGLEAYNTGVIPYTQGSPVLSLWKELCFHHNDLFATEQEALNFLIDQEGIEITELPSAYNWKIQDRIHPEAVILHWAGPWGKEAIRRALSIGKANKPS